MNNQNKAEASKPKIDWQHSLRIESVLFLLIVLIEAGIIFYLMYERRIVGGHDGFQFFIMRYYFLNNVVNCGEIPFWIPFMTHGNVSIIGYILLGGILQNVLFFSGSLLKGINFLPIFYAGFFVDELLLLVGAWLLTRRFFASPFTVFFVSLSIMGSCIWVLQPWFNFHFYYAIPLILHFIHMFLDSGKWRYYLLAGNLLAVQMIGNLPYFFSVISLVIFLYFFFYFMFNCKNAWQKIKGINFGWAFYLSSISIIIVFAGLYITVKAGADQIVHYNFLRDADGATTLDGFLFYGGKLSWKTWLEMITGISPCLDYTLYTGILCVPFVLFGLIFNLRKRNVHFLLTACILLLFSLGTFVSISFYYFWPTMKFYRHLILVAPIIKIFFCFLSGFGFDALFFDKSHFKKNSLVMEGFLTVVAILMFFTSLLAYVLSNNYHVYANLIRGMVPEKLPMFMVLFNEEIMSSMLHRTSFFALIAAILFELSTVLTRGKHLFAPVIILLLTHCADIYTFKIFEIKQKTTLISEEMYKITSFQTMPYAKRREASILPDNPRAELLKVLPIQESGAFYWSTYAFLFKDVLGSSFRTDYWSLPLDNYMRAYWGQSVHDLSKKPLGLLDNSHLKFPTEHSAALKISGVTEDKIQFFSQADTISSDDVIVSNITNANYKGDIIFLSPLKKNKNLNAVDSSDLPKNYLSSNKRLHLPYQVQRYDSNNIEITINNNDIESAWLLYSDVWHPFWRATVNGKEAPVYKANLAYKAIKLEKGFNTIHFRFSHELISVVFFFFGLNLFFWLITIIGLSGKIAIHGSGMILGGNVNTQQVFV